MAKKKPVVQDEVQKEFPVVAQMSEVAANETPVVEVALDAKRSVVHSDEVAALKDSRKRDLPLFKVSNGDCGLWDLLHDAAGFLEPDTAIYQRVSAALDVDALWIVAISEHQAKLAIIDYAYPMEKVSKKDRNDRYLELLEIAADTQTPPI